jgi:hypothetical protein
LRMRHVRPDTKKNNVPGSVMPTRGESYKECGGRRDEQ